MTPISSVATAAVSDVAERTEAPPRTGEADRLVDVLSAPMAPAALRRVVMPAPLASPEDFLELVTDREFSFIWHPPQGAAVAGIGAAAIIEVEGASRFTDLRTAADALWPRVETTALGSPELDLPTVEARLYGGFAFDVDASQAAPWREFGDGCFTLPRWLYHRQDDRAALVLTVSSDDLATEGCESWRHEAQRLLTGLDRRGLHVVSAEAGDPHRPLNGTVVDDADWIQRIDSIRQAIGDGEVEKIVAARRSQVAVASDLDAVDVLRRLGNGLRASAKFAFWRHNSVFLGATPERLISQHGQRFETEALAGSIETGAEHAAALLDSGKDRHEQQLVVDSIVRRLRPLCERLQVADRPTVRELREVLHLHTPIVGLLSRPGHVLELVERLHPTPAVGGVPTAEAQRWIAERETDARGWYASPIGWFDARGDGEFSVALRSCVLTGESAYLFAGAGIVADSDPRLELRETELKTQVLRSALGACVDGG